MIRRDGNHYLLIRDCYVLSLMDGEAMKDLDESRDTDLPFW